ncbi:hypothetical protein AXF42_Ash000799 [Apostasia shenzhenica]|uniref:Uncharacterized protein n=1 Tax=Apostasia shenzhenica TaxID=1088818 RepID=A0A2I0AT85_9ASPA|nr:hypothetical protein AXF42_Ash000799 [Apostasia shenzhenica]
MADFTLSVLANPLYDPEGMRRNSSARDQTQTLYLWDIGIEEEENPKLSLSHSTFKRNQISFVPLAR